VLLAILLAVLGGIAPSGGAGRIVGVVLAAFILQFLSTGLNLLFQSSSSNFLKDFAWGATLLLVLAIGRIQEGSFAQAFARPREPAEASKTQPS
jgi:simple sugar transport system permease protein